MNLSIYGNLRGKFTVSPGLGDAIMLSIDDPKKERVLYIEVDVNEFLKLAETIKYLMERKGADRYNG